ncbi:hypothetical protein COLO4_10689 [Corchorus olitorius]|uniref:DUF7356 domain-containing protein n=1 Tax=Corchorus olitorius TaxID=93759 RepID=A0A1R3K7B3_9ROSI|nr:hypothetical protein COLO4_10689 [Corchorus olitorius]
MERNYTLLMGLLLLLAAVDYCSSFHPKANLYEEGGFKLAQNSPLGGNYDGSINTKYVSDSSNSVKENGGDQVDYGLLEKSSQLGNMMSQQSEYSTDDQDDQNLQKNEKLVLMEGKINDGENLVANIEEEGKKEGGYDMLKVWESLNYYVEEKGYYKMDGDENYYGDENIEDENMYMDSEESNVEAKGKPGGEKEDEQNIHKVYEDALMPQDSMIEEWAYGKKEVNQSMHKGYEGSNEKGGENLPEVHDELTTSINETKEKMESCERMGNLDDHNEGGWPKRFDYTFPVEECDPYLGGQNFSMCFRIPGNDAPKLSLEIKSTEIGPLTIKISAPSFRQLDETEIEILQGKQDKKATVSIKESGTLIVFRDSSGGGGCDVDIKELASVNLAKAFLN